MPTNLPPEASAAEKRYKAAVELPDKIARLQEFVGLIPKHKGTDKLRASLRKRLSKLRAQQTSGAQKSSGGRSSDAAWHIDREGLGQIVIIGPANTGKSSLLAALSKATPEIADYPWTTRVPIPGMMTFENVRIQLIDTPPLSAEHIEAEHIDLMRRASALLLVIDLSDPDPTGQLENSLQLLREHKITFQQISQQSPDNDRQPGLPLLTAVNKVDDPAAREDFEVLLELLESNWPLLPVSAESQQGLDELRRSLFESLGLMRIYSKPPGKKADLDSPFSIAIGGTVGDLAAVVHRDFAEKLRSARLWGPGTPEGGTVGRDHVLHEGDIVQLQLPK
jgi:ribosome-interacting GTPase 1